MLLLLLLLLGRALLLLMLLMLLVLLVLRSHHALLLLLLLLTLHRHLGEVLLLTEVGEVLLMGITLLLHALLYQGSRTLLC